MATDPPVLDLLSDQSKVVTDVVVVLRDLHNIDKMQRRQIDSLNRRVLLLFVLVLALFVIGLMETLTR